MNTTEPCNICGCTQTNLVDGFYYCAECGTQDTNVRETLVEFTTLGDGGTALGSRRRITQIPQATEVEMTEDWYKWHTLNFLLIGLADEVIELGAAPTFKTKLLWVWTRYMKKYQNKADFGLVTNEDSDDEYDKPNMNGKAYSSDEDDEEIGRIERNKYISIKKISMSLVITFLYVALNLDKSHIQLAHLLRFMRERRISIMHWQKFVPQEMRPKRLRKCLFFDYQSFKFSFHVVRHLGLQLFRDLDLGNPIVPDVRLLLDKYIKELCLPNDLKPLVISIMHSRSYDYLDMNVQYNDMRRLPSYELYVISHILMALKICFGLDCEYEVKLSDAVDKINELEDHPKSYNGEPTERLFSFREWCSYIQFRKTLLRTHTLHLGAPNYFDMNDYVAFEHQNDRPDYKITLKDEIARDIIHKIESGDVNVIPRSEFIPTMTPHYTYARVIMEHQQDLNVKTLLGEDFTQYSLKYITKDLFLVDPDSINPKNILTGVGERTIKDSNKVFDLINPSFTFTKEMVYVKDCDNHNWMITQRPQLEHVSTAEKENDHGYESNSETLQNVLNASIIDLDNTQNSVTKAKQNCVIGDTHNNKVHDDLSSITDIEMEIENEKKSDDAVIVDNSSTNIYSEIKDPGHVDGDAPLLKIPEEEEGKNIFDDDFVNLESKKEEEKEPDNSDEEVLGEHNESFNVPEKFRYDDLSQQYVAEDKDSDASSIDSIHLNPESLDRNEAIKELVIHACNKYKISLPGKYIHLPKRVNRNTKRVMNGKINGPRFRGETTLKINNLMAAYHSHIEHDVLHQMTNMVQSAIANFNQTKQDTETPMEIDDPPSIDDEIPAVRDQTVENELTNTNQELDHNETAADVSEYNLFGDSSDGETHAEDLLPKKNPEFDEKTHDIRQLYIKTVEAPTAPEMELNPNLFKIIDRQIKADKTEPEAPAEEKNKSDSEEEVSLSILQEQKQIRFQLSEQARRTKNSGLKHLIENDDIPPFNYWVRHYTQIVAALSSVNQRFANDIDKTLPKSFVFVLKECADVSGYPPFNVYNTLQRIEECFKDKYVSRKRFTPTYFMKKKRYKRGREF